MESPLNQNSESVSQQAPSRYKSSAEYNYPHAMPSVRSDVENSLQSDEAGEIKLVQDCLASKPAAQERFYKHFYGYIMSIALRYAKHAEEAKEITNDSFIKVFRNLQRYDEQRSLKAWLRRIVINTALDRLRQNKRDLHQVAIDQLKIEAPQESIIDKLSAEDIINLLRRLSDAQRTVFNLFEIEGFSHEEISQILGIPIGTSKSHLARAKIKLRQLIVEKYGK